MSLVPSVYVTEISFLSTSSAANLHVGQTLAVALQTLCYLPFRGFPFKDVAFRVDINLLTSRENNVGEQSSFQLVFPCFCVERHAWHPLQTYGHTLQG